MLNYALILLSNDETRTAKTRRYVAFFERTVKHFDAELTDCLVECAYVYAKRLRRKAFKQCRTSCPLCNSDIDTECENSIPLKRTNMKPEVKNITKTVSNIHPHFLEMNI